MLAIGWGTIKNAPLPLRQTIRLEGVSGRMDHMDIDVGGKRLFVAALGNDTVEVVGLVAGKRAGTIHGLREPQGVLYVPEHDRIVVANGGDGTVRFFDGKSFRPAGTVGALEDADNLRYDPATHRIYVGYGNGAIGVLRSETGEKIGDVKLAGHPESFQLETKGSRIFVNVPAAHSLAVIDREKAVVTETWPMKDFRSNFPMALDEANHRVFVGCRSPAKLVILDSDSGKVIASPDCVGDVDDVFYDAAARRIFLSGGEGRIDVFEQIDADHYELVSRTPTADGARTSFFATALETLFVAIPRRADRDAELNVYTVE